MITTSETVLLLDQLHPSKYAPSILSEARHPSRYPAKCQSTQSTDHRKSPLALSIIDPPTAYKAKRQENPAFQSHCPKWWKNDEMKFVGVPQTPEPISAVSGPKFTILSGQVDEVLLLNKFFSDCRYMP